MSYFVGIIKICIFAYFVLLIMWIFMDLLLISVYIWMLVDNKVISNYKYYKLSYKRFIMQ